MWTLFVVIAFSGFASAIRVPIANLEDTLKDASLLENSQQILYSPNNLGSSSNLNSETEIETPATFLLPPVDESLYLKPQEIQNDWYPIAPSIPQGSKSAEHLENLRTAKIQRDALPATILSPPLENALNFYFSDPLTASVPRARQPTILYPKKFVGYKPVPIPIAQFAENLTEIPRAKPLKPLMPYPSIDGVYITPIDGKKQYLYNQTEEKKKIKKEQEAIQYVAPEESVQNNEKNSSPSEQETSETIHNYPEHGRHLKGQNVKRPVYVPANNGERTEFQMHGMNGPHSYQFGFDTGKGKNRQFRYEERDNDGHVRGHYGYMDKSGKLRVVKYDADPKLGFRAEPPVVQD